MLGSRRTGSRALAASLAVITLTLALVSTRPYSATLDVPINASILRVLSIYESRLSFTTPIEETLTSRVFSNPTSCLLIGITILRKIRSYSVDELAIMS